MYTAQWKTIPPAKHRDTSARFIHCQLHSTSNGSSTCLICTVSTLQSHRKEMSLTKHCDWIELSAGGNISWHLAWQEEAVRKGTASIAWSLHSAGVLSTKWCLKMHKDTGERAHTSMNAHKQSAKRVHIHTPTCAYTHTHAQRTVETPPASPVPSVSLSVLHSRAQTGPQQSQCEISCLCRALSACTCLFGCTRMLGLDAYFKTYLPSDCQEVTHVGALLCLFLCT